MMMTALGDFDHCMVLVEDLDGTDRRLERLGFRPTPRGVHSASMGTANSTVLFRNRTYLEPLGILAPTPLNAGQRKRLAEHEGPYGLAFKTDDATAAAALLAALGLGDGTVVEFARPVETAHGPEMAAFTVARTLPSSLPGGWFFCCQHHRPDLVWREDYLDHPNGALGLRLLIAAVDSLDFAAEAYGPLFGDRLQIEADRIVIAAGTTQILLLRGPTFLELYGLPPEPASDRGVRFAAMAIEVAAIERAAAGLAEAGVPFSRPEPHRCIVAAELFASTILELIEPSKAR
jgi:hypothetical protein